jgi:hypothetical protein
MAHSAVIHARIDSSTKEATERVLNALGLTPTEAIRLLYRQITVTATAMSEADRGEGLESFATTEDLYASWDK